MTLAYSFQQSQLLVSYHMEYISITGFEKYIVYCSCIAKIEQFGGNK